MSRRPTPRHRRPLATVHPALEPLEVRRLLAAVGGSITFAYGELILRGTDGDDVMTLRGNATLTRITATVNGRSATHSAGKIARVVVDAGAGRDRLSVGSVAQPLLGKPILADGGLDRDTLRGGEMGDTLRGGSSHDRLYGGAGDDLLEGGPGNDVLWGQAGRDSLWGGRGNDSLNDTTIGDELIGSAGTDTFNGVVEGSPPPPTPEPDPEPKPDPKPDPEPKPQPEPEPEPEPEPPAPGVDASIRKRGDLDTAFIGDDVVNATGEAQIYRQNALHVPVIYEVRAFNRTAVAQRIVIKSTGPSAGWEARFLDSIAVGYDGGKDITEAVTSPSGWASAVVQPGKAMSFRVDVRPTMYAEGGSLDSLRITMSPESGQGASDTVVARSTAIVQRIPEIRRRNFDASGVYRFEIQNQGNVRDTFVVRAPAGDGTWSVRYYDDEFGGNDVTEAVTSAAGWRTVELAPKEKVGMRIVINRRGGPVRSVTLSAHSAADASKEDHATFTTVDPAPGPDFFVIGAWSQPTYNFALWKSRGANTLVHYEGLSGTVSLDHWISEANRHGFYQIREWRTDLARDAKEPLLLGYVLPDEPDVRVGQGDTDLAKYNALKAVNPLVPVLGNFAGSHLLNWHPQNNFTRAQYEHELLDARDWGMQGVYPISGWGHPERLDGPGRALDRLEKMMEGKPQIAVLDSGDQDLSWTPHSLRGPTPGEFRYTIWDNVIRGANGVVYFPFKFKPRFAFDNVAPDVEAEMKAEHFFLKDLSSVLVSPIDPPEVGAEVKGPLEAGWRIHDGRAYFIVLNMSGRALDDARVTLHGVGSSRELTVRWEDRTVSLAGGSFTDDFEAFDYHVYELPLAGAAAAAMAAPAAAPRPLFAERPAFGAEDAEDAEDDAGVLA